jgi:LmbE family N-acetylglucosaminyl deacetylase
MKKILVVAAHPDDEVLGCGGTVARLIKEGYAAYSLILGEGITSRDAIRDTGKREKELQALKAQAKKANQCLGIKELWMHDFPDNRFDTVALLDIIKVVEKHVNALKPDIVFTHAENDLNIDHRITFQAALTATRPKKGQSVRDLFCFEVPSSTDWTFTKSFLPNVFYDISSTLKLKQKSLLHYASEMFAFPHPRSQQNIENMASRWGAVAGMRHAEAFMQIRSLR